MEKREITYLGVAVEYSEDLGIAQLSLSALLSCVVLGTAAFFISEAHTGAL